MADLNLRLPPIGPNRPKNTIEWIALLTNTIAEIKGIEWFSDISLSIKQLCTAINNDPDFANTVTSAINLKLDAATYTATDILNKLKTVDGAGSGLDADKVKGYIPVDKAGDIMTGFLTLNADPSQPLHAVTKQYVDSAIQGLDVKPSVRAATTSNIVLSGAQTIDGVALVFGDRVLVKDQADAKQNGVYLVQAGPWIRALDFDDIPDTEIDGGEFVFVQEGTVNADMGFVLVTNAPVHVGTDPMVFTQFSGAGQVVPGAGLEKIGNSIGLTTTGVVAGTYTKVTVDSRGRVTSATSLSASDIPNLDWAKITSGKPTTLSGYGITDGVNVSEVVTSPASNKILKLDATGKLPTSITGNADGNAATATKLQTARTITITGDVDGSASFDGSTNINIDVSLDNTGVSVGTYTKVTVNAKGLVTSAGNLLASDIPAHDWSKITSGKPTTIAGYGITDAVNKAGDTMTGALIISNLGPYLQLSDTDGKTYFLVSDGDNFSLRKDTIGTTPYPLEYVYASNELRTNGNKIWHIGNQGAASGMDADLLDGQHASYYTNITARLGYTPLNKAGDTMLGYLTLNGDPTQALHAVTKQYVDGLVQGLDIKASVRVATTANIVLSGTQTIDGVALVAGDRVLVKDQTTASQNGVYIVSAGAWTRATDADTSAKVTSGMYVFVEEGSINADSGWALATNGVITLGTTALTFIQFSGAGQITAGTGLTKTGNTISINGTVWTSANLSPVDIGSAQDISGRKALIGGDHTWDANGSRGALEVRGPSSTAPAIMAFHRPSSYAAYFGIDTDNFWKVGGWSAGAVKYKIWHEGNQGTGSGLNADTVDGIHGTDLRWYDGWVVSPGINANTMAVSKSGFTYSNNAPYTGPIVHFDAGGFGLQLNATYVGGSSLSFRTRNGDTAAWNTWREILCIADANTAGMFDRSATAPTGTTRLNYSGYLYATRVYNAVYNDYAEYFLKGEFDIEPGDIIMMDTHSDAYIKSEGAYSRLVVGIVSDDYAQCIGGLGDGNDDTNFSPVGMAGRVRVKVTGNIRKGDFIVASDIRGVGMASNGYTPGTVVAKALEDHFGDSIDRIRALVLNA